jgi:hypothetical protein
MPKIKNTITMSLEEFGKKAGEYALDEYEYNGLTIRQWADKITSGEYQPVRHGRWIKLYPYQYKCSSCGARVWIKFYPLEEYKFCWHCGAKMDGDAE